MDTNGTFSALAKSNPKYQILRSQAKLLQAQLKATKRSRDDTAQTYTCASNPTHNFYYYNTSSPGTDMLPAAKSTLASALGTAVHSLVLLLASSTTKNFGTFLQHGTIPIQLEAALAIHMHLKEIGFTVDSKRDLKVKTTVFGVQLFADLFVRKSTSPKELAVCEIKTIWAAKEDINVVTDTAHTHREQALMGAIGTNQKCGALALIVIIPCTPEESRLTVKSMYYPAKEVKTIVSMIWPNGRE